VEDLDVPPRREHLPECGKKLAIEFDREHVVDGGRERHGERSESRADLDNVVPPANEIRDRAREVRIDQKVLTERPGRPDAVSTRERSNRPGAEAVGGAARVTS
jgi:hypothetical protein